MLQDETGKGTLEAVRNILENRYKHVVRVDTDDADAIRINNDKQMSPPGGQIFGDENDDETKHEPEGKRHNKDNAYTDIADLVMSDDEIQENPDDPLHKQKHAFDGDEEDGDMSDDGEDEESKTID